MSEMLVSVPVSGPGPVARAGMVTVSTAKRSLPGRRHADEARDRTAMDQPATHRGQRSTNHTDQISPKVQKPEAP